MIGPRLDAVEWTETEQRCLGRRNGSGFGWFSLLSTLLLLLVLPRSAETARLTKLSLLFTPVSSIIPT
jgi:hypothetical protein